MIARAIKELLYVSEITDIAGVYYSTAPQNVSYPFIVYRESSVTENFKNDSKIRLHSLEVVIVTTKGRDGNDGFADLESLKTIVESKLNRFTGMAGGKKIQSIILDESDIYFDQMSKNAIATMEYEVREDYSAALADPANYPINYTINVNGVEDSIGTINGYANNTFNITV